MALAWSRIVASRCPGCGTLPDEWPDRSKVSDEPDPYGAQSRRCFGCEMLQVARADVPSDEKGVYVELVPAELLDVEED